VAVLNTNVSAATSLLTWTCLDVIFFGKPSVIGAVQGMMTGLVCVTAGAGNIFFCSNRDPPYLENVHYRLHAT
jgi:Amt family ammonium transporter